MTQEFKKNGFELNEAVAAVVEQFVKAAVKLFGDEIRIEHFFYGENLDMIDIRLTDKNYGCFNVTAKRVSFNGHTCTFEQYDKFAALTYNDELFVGRLFDIA